MTDTFQTTLNGITTTGAKAGTAAMKAAGFTRIKAKVLGVVSIAPARLTPTPLTKDEREYLGASVLLPDGRRGQVWSLGLDRGCLWAAVPTGNGTNELVMAHVLTVCGVIPFAASDLFDSVRACGICGEREGSVYAKHCCTDDQMIEA